MEISASLAGGQAKSPNTRFGGDTQMGETFDNFLLLLTTQLQNQDPLSPMDTHEFTQQLVGFAGVEQQIAANQKLEKLLDLQGYNQLAAGVSLIGREVEADGDQLTLSQGSARGAYSLESSAKQTQIRIFDAHGRLIRQMPGALAPGRHVLEWDGRNDSGLSVADGVYGFSVHALDEDDNPVAATTTTFGRVTGVESGDRGPALRIGEALIPLVLVTRVHE